ncbi:MAG: TonB-dependent receptor-like protein, partial [Gammaproteobacteria bacterium]|nr:TonB-dependent receptor-like protein [Gammaproteobacteria bacterium]
MTCLMSKLKLGGLTIAWSAAATGIPAAAFAQVARAEPGKPTAAPTEILEEIVVTGSSIRGATPVGSNLVTIDSKAISEAGAVSVQQALANVPALTGLGNVGQGQTNNSYYQPAIHQLGASASNSTLILIDGHRPVTGGTNHSTADPNVIPINMIERVEVLADGASSIYGSDAVAGVVNFITRKSFDGVQATGSVGFINGANSESGGLLTGRSWTDGSAIFAYSYSRQGALNGTDRSYTNPNHIPQGGTNFGNFNCDPATLQPGGTGGIFLNAAAGSSVANTAANSPCSQWAYGAATPLLQRETRHNFMLKTSQEFGDDLTLSSEFVYGRRRDDGEISAGTVTATAFGAGAQANPFYQKPAGYTGTATSETVRWDADALLGPGHTFNGADTVYGDVNAEFRVGDTWAIDLLALAGRDDSFTDTTGVINGSVATLALNGTTNSGGSLTSISVPGTNIIVSGLPLTAANALDVWNPAGSNGTSAAVRAALLDNANLIRLVYGIQQFRLSANGSLFDLPGGAVRLAVGAEDLRNQLDEQVDRANNSGPASTGSQYLTYNFTRTVNSGFAELDVPVIGHAMGIPLARRVELNASGRYDNYSDFGSTTNPKLSLDWEMVEGFKLRGNVSRSFVAPPLDVLGDAHGAFATAGWNSVTNSLAVPVAAYPQLTQMGIPGCTATSVTCNISSLQGLQVTSGDHHMKAQKGRGWSVGADFNPEFVPHLNVAVTLWNTQFTGAVTGPNVQNVVNTASMNQLLTFYPGGATAAQIAAATAGIPQRSTVPNSVGYIFQSLNSNWLNLYVRGIDASVSYSFDAGKWGTFKSTAALTEFLKFDQSLGNGPTYNELDTSGNNTSFPSIETQGRFDLGWAGYGLSADLFMNYTGSYHNWSGTSVA